MNKQENQWRSYDFLITYDLIALFKTKYFEAIAYFIFEQIVCQKVPSDEIVRQIDFFYGLNLFGEKD